MGPDLLAVAAGDRQKWMRFHMDNGLSTKSSSPEEAARRFAAAVNC